jgi:hypothetical protein
MKHTTSKGDKTIAFSHILALFSGKDIDDYCYDRGFKLNQIFDKDLE